MRRSLASRRVVCLGIKVCVVLSMFILYHLLYSDQETKLHTPVTDLIPLKDIRRTGVELESLKYRLTAITDTSSNALNSHDNNTSVSISNPAEFEADTRLKFLFVLHHYEQLTKTTENLLHLSAVAEQIDRVIVEPFVRDSRMCGLPYGWSGQLRSERRRFYPLSLYFDVKFMNNLLKKSRLAPMVKLETFKRRCRSSVTNTTLLHFMYKDRSQEEMEKWFKISAPVYHTIEENIKNSGWCKCNFIDHGLNVSKRIGNLRADRQICIDAERVKSIKLFKSEILKDDKCVVIIHWRGFGKDRSHFKPEVKVDNRKLLHSLRSSERVRDQAKTIEEAIGGEYISVHIRSERQIQWYDVERLSRCIKTLVEKIADLKQKYQIKKVFLSSDFSRFGSDTLHSLTAQNNTLTNRIKQLQRFLSKTLKPKKFKPRSDDPMAIDSGVVALTEMNVLIGGSHLMTIGSGTFQQWIVEGFVERKNGSKQQNNWTITRICHREEKLNNYKSS